MSRGDQEVFLVAPKRSAIGRFGGGLSAVRADDLLAHLFKSVVAQAEVDPSAFDDVIAGCANQAGEDNRNVARMAAVLAGFPDSVPGVTVNRLCASSLEAVNMASRAIWSGDAEMILVGGVEVMSRSPYVMPRNATGKAVFGNLTAFDTALGWRFPNPKMEAIFPLEAMGCTAENLADAHAISREDQDAFAFASQQKALAARESGAFDAEIVPVEIPQRKGEAVVISRDEGPRRHLDGEVGALEASVSKRGAASPLATAQR